MMIFKKIKLSLSENSLQAKISKGIAWSFLGTFISKGLMLFSFVLIARIISVEEYGQVGIIRNTIATLAAFSVMSFGVTATKYLAIYKDNEPDRAEKIITFTRGFVFISSVFISSFVFIFSDYIATNLLNNTLLSYDVKISSFAIFFTALNGYQNGLLAGLEKFKELSYINILNGLLTFPILILFTYFWGVHGIVAGLGIVSFLTWFMSDYYVRLSMKANALNYRFTGLLDELNTIKYFTIPSFLSGLFVVPAILIANLSLTNQENGYYQLGVFNAAYTFSVIVITLNAVIGQVVYPYAIQQFKKNNKKFEYFNIISPWIIGIGLNLPLIIFPELMVLSLGTKYDNESFKTSVILVSLFSIIIAHRQGIARNFAAANLMWWSVLSNMFWGLILISLTSQLYTLGSIGLAISFLLSYGINSIVFLPLYLKKGLVERKLLIPAPILLIWLLLILSPVISFYTRGVFLKISLLVGLFLIIGYLFKVVWRDYNS